MSLYNDHLLVPSSRARRRERVAQRREGARVCHAWQDEIIPQEELDTPVLSYEPLSTLSDQQYDPALELLLSDDWSLEDLSFTAKFSPTPIKEAK